MLVGCPGLSGCRGIPSCPFWVAEAGFCASVGAETWDTGCCWRCAIGFGAGEGLETFDGPGGPDVEGVGVFVAAPEVGTFQVCCVALFEGLWCCD